MLQGFLCFMADYLIRAASDIVDWIGYQPDTATLFVALKGRKKKTQAYVYGGVSVTLFKSFLAAASKGHFFTEFIRPLPFRKGDLRDLESWLDDLEYE